MSLNQTAAAADVHVASSAVILGLLRAGPGSLVAQGAVVRSPAGAVEIGASSALLENGVAIGSAAFPVSVGQKVVFGHRCLLIGAAVGDLSEIGNGSILMPGVRVGRRCFLGEGTVLLARTVVPDESVVVGRPGRAIRRASEADLRRLAALRDGDFSLPPYLLQPLAGTLPAGATMGKLYSFRDKEPRVAPSAVLFDTAEITGDVWIGAESIVAAGVKIIGDSHGPVRVGERVQILRTPCLHLLPDNELVIEDDVVIGPGAMIHGCRIGKGTVVEPGALVCDFSTVGEESVVLAGACLKQRSRFGPRAILDGFPARKVGELHTAPGLPGWALKRADLGTLSRRR
jgi:carbonic anhydrase/acetyltransferase-like protein (isoleucine patch superfamily)